MTSLRVRTATGFVAALILAAGTAGAQVPAAPAVPPPPPPVVAPAQAPPATPVPPKAPATASCEDAAKALPKLPAAPQGALMIGAHILPSGSPTQFTYVAPAGQTAQTVQFRVFLAPPGRAPGPLTVLSVAHPPASTNGLTDNQSAYGIEAQVGTRPGMGPYEKDALTVLACDPQAGGVVGFASAPVWTSNFVFALAVALAIMVAAYGLAGWVRWMATCATRDVNHTLAFRLAASNRARARLSSARPPLSLGDCFNPVVISADVFYRANLPQLQVLFFLMLTGFGVSFSLLRGGALSDLSASVVFLLGIPAAGALGSQAVSGARDRFSTDNWSWLVDHGVLAIDDPGTRKPQWRDLLLTGSSIDLYKLQALVFSVIVGVAMIISIFSGVNSLQTFKVPDTLLQILGLSQVVFVGGHFTAPATVGDADNLVTELRSRACNLQVAAATGIDINCDGQPLRTADPNSPAPAMNKVTSITQAYAIVPIAAAHYEDIANEVEIVLKGLTYRDVVTDRLRDPFAWRNPPAPPKQVPPGPPPAAPPADPPPAPPTAPGV